MRAIVQYSTLSVTREVTELRQVRNLNYDVLLTYLTSPGTAFYVGANYNLAATGWTWPTALANDGWQVFTKVSYLIRR